MNNYLVSILLLLFCSTSFGAWNTNVKKDSGGHLYVNGIFPYLCANDDLCLNRTTATTGEIDIAGKQAITVTKATSGTYANVGIGGAASLSDSFPLYLLRSVAGPSLLLLENANNSAGDGAKIQVKAGAGGSTFEMGLFATSTAAPDAYSGGRATLRCTDSCPGISAISDGGATGDMKFYMGGNAAGNLMFKMDQFGLTLSPNAANRPTCDSTKRGMLYNKIGGAGVADELDMCMKSSGDTYSWVTVKAAS